MNIDIESIVILNSIDGLGPVKIKALAGRFADVKKIFKAKQGELCRVEGISPKLADSILSPDKNLDIKKEFSLIKKFKINLISIFDEDYPQNLKKIYDPPVILYVKGKIAKEDNIALAIVGTRTPTYYGLNTAQKFAMELSSKGFCIISGLARGIDTQAHKGALLANGRTIAVLGSGLANIYPKENIELADKICASGAVVSEFPMQTEPYKDNFPRRNRIISGLSIGVLVVEAAQQSGSLITADFALQQGREVFAVPGNMDSAVSRGANQLIKDGAKLVENSLDIVEELAPLLRDYVKKGGNDAQAKLTPEEKIIYNKLTDEPMHIDEVIELSALSASKASSLLTILEMKGIVKQFPGKLFSKS